MSTPGYCKTPELGESDDAEWKTVTKLDKKRVSHRKRVKQSKKQGHAFPIENSSILSQDEIHCLVKHCRSALPRTYFFEQLTAALLKAPTVATIVCYGIGNFADRYSSPSASQWQLSCILHLVALWQSGDKEIKVYYFEPLMTANEREFLLSVSINIIPENERSRRKIVEPSLFFMPHCPLSLYSNLLFTNREDLKNVWLFGNSLSAYTSRFRKDHHSNIIRCLEPYWQESSIIMSKDDISTMSGNFEHAFNDSALTYFPTAPIHPIHEDLIVQLLCAKEDSEVV